MFVSCSKWRARVHRDKAPMVVSMMASTAYNNTIVKQKVPGSIPIAGFAGVEPLTEPRLSGALTAHEGDAILGKTPNNADKVATNTPWRLKLPTPDFGKFLSPGVGTVAETAKHTYQRIRQRVSPTRRQRREKRTPKARAPKTPGAEGDDVGKDDLSTARVGTTPGSVAPKTPVPTRHHKERAIAEWCEGAGIDSIEGLTEVRQPKVANQPLGV